MPLTQGEFEALIADPTKEVRRDIEWVEDEDHSPSVVFRAQVVSEPGYPLMVCGSFNREARTLSYAPIHRAVGRIYGLDLGKAHHNPTCETVGECHKHRWREDSKDKVAYVPPDIDAPVTDPVAVWQQFCVEAAITHVGEMFEPPPVQELLPI